MLQPPSDRSFAVRNSEQDVPPIDARPKGLGRRHPKVLRTPIQTEPTSTAEVIKDQQLSGGLNPKEGTSDPHFYRFMRKALSAASRRVSTTERTGEPERKQ